MGSGVDPHLYKATQGDVAKFANADIIVYNGLHLEGKLEDIFHKLAQKKEVIEVSKGIDRGFLISSKNFKSNYDPHVWFHIDYWIACTNYLTDNLCKMAPEHHNDFRENSENYIKQLREPVSYTHLTLPTTSRV